MRARRSVQKKNWMIGDHNAYVFVTGPERRRNAIVGVAYKRISKQQRNNMLAEAATRAFQHESVTTVLVLGVDVESVDRRVPYDVLAVFGRPA